MTGNFTADWLCAASDALVAEAGVHTLIRHIAYRQDEDHSLYVEDWQPHPPRANEVLSFRLDELSSRLDRAIRLGCSIDTLGTITGEFDALAELTRWVLDR